MPIELQKALTTSNATALLPYDLEPVLHEELIALQPLIQLVSFSQAQSKTHEYTVRSTHPQGWFEGETTPANAKVGTYARKSVQVKIGRIWGSVTGFAQSMDEAFIDALATEIDGSLQGMADLLEYSILFGCSSDVYTGDAYQTTGILANIYANAAATNVIDAGGDKISLDDLDAVLAACNQHRQTRNDPGLFFMGIKMKQVVDGLQTKVQMPVQSAELYDGKLIMGAYAGKPILETNYMVPGTTSPAAATALAAGGTLPDATVFNYRISSVTMYGECIAGTKGTERTTGTSNFKVTITWTADANALLYMIWQGVGASTTTWKLLDIIAAKTYDADGTISGTVATYTDDGSKTVNASVEALETGEQLIVYVNRHPVRGVNFIGKIDDMGRPIENFMKYVELARVKDTYDYMIKMYFAVLMRYSNVHAVIRHAKLA